MLTTKFSHYIAMYKESYKELGYSPLSDRSLFRILHSIKPSKRKCLAGLDDISAAGMTGFETLSNVSLKFNRKDLADNLERGKRYLKTNYQTHCADETTNIASHSAAFGLSDPKVQKLQGESDLKDFVICFECNDLCTSLQEIRQLVENLAPNDEDIMYDINIAITNIQEYINHVMRNSQQKKAKAAAFQKLDQTSALWLKDFAQKILPVKFREGQKDYFGKKGMSLHVDVFFVRKEELLVKHVYLTVIYRCEQNTSSIISIADIVLNEFKVDEPDVKKLFTKSDNAGCYHGNFSAESMYTLCNQKGFELQRYDFNEPCCGKD